MRSTDSGTHAASHASRSAPLTPRDRAAFLAALAAVAVWRFVQVRGLELPAWVDAVHHALLVRILLERSLPDTWAPYLPHVPLYYHFGFHASAALLAKVAGWDGLQLGRAVLLAGQTWQVALAAGVYRLALSLGRSPARALAALLLVGFVSEMPAYYVAWSRYTLLAGLTLLVWAAVAAIAARPVALALLVAATALTHYYAFVLLLAFVASLLAFGPTEARRRVAAGAALGVALVTPWLWRVAAWTHAFERPHPGPPAAPVASTAAGAPPLVALLGPARNHVLVALALAGAAVLVRGVIARRATRAETAFLAWTGLPSALLLVHVGPFRPDHAAIVLFLPVVVLAAHALVTLGAPGLRAVALAGLLAWGVVETRDVVDATTLLARPGDLAAIAWVDANTPRDAAFLVDVAPWMGIWRGRDGGWWITPLTGRRTVLPPLAYSFGPPEETAEIRRVARWTSRLATLPRQEYCRELAGLMDETRASYYFTHSEEPARCPGLAAVFRSAELGVYASRGGSVGVRAGDGPQAGSGVVVENEERAARAPRGERDRQP